MANYNTLKTAIQNAIYENHNNEIDALDLRQTLITIVNSLGVGYQLIGVAMENTNPGTPDQNVFYIAGPGTYPNFGATPPTVQEGYLGIFRWNGNWTFNYVPVGKDFTEEINQLAQELIEVVGIVYDGKYVNISGNLVADPNWFVIEYNLPSSVIAGDVFVWNGIESGAAKCIAFYLDSTFKTSRGATGTSRTFTIAEGEATIGANIIRASFLKSKRLESYVSRNGATLNPLDKTRIDVLEQALTDTDTKTFTGIFSSSNIDNVRTVGTYLRDKAEAQYASTILLVHKDSANLWQVLLSPDSPYLQMRTYSNGAWGAWGGLFLLASEIDDVPTAESNKPVKSGGIFSAILSVVSIIDKLRSSTPTQVVIPTMERGTIATNGTDYSNNLALRVPNDARISVSNKQVLAWGYLYNVISIVPDAAKFMMNVHCYNSSGASLGRTTAGWTQVQDGFVFPLLANTAQIRFAISFQKANGSDISLTDEQATALISAMSNILSVRVYDESLDTLRSDLLKVESREVNTDRIPTEGSAKLITSGGVYAALNNGAIQYPYMGMPIQIKQRLRFDVEEYMIIIKPTMANSGQGCINWGNKLLVGGDGGYIRVYDLDAKSYLGENTLASASASNHVNNLCFGIEGDSGNENFPKYLYVSECNGSAENLNRCFVENFKLSGSTLIQTISYSGGASAFPGGFQWVVDTDNGYIYVIGQTTSSYAAQNAKIGFRKFILPSISDGAVVELTDSDVVESFEHDATFDAMYIYQGAYYYDGKIFLCTGGYDNGTTSDMPHRIFVIDLLNGNIVSLIDVRQVLRAECEACFVYKGHLFACYPNSSKLLAFSF